MLRLLFFPLVVFGAAACRHAPALVPRAGGGSSFQFVEAPSAAPSANAEIAGDGPREPVVTMLLAVPLHPLAKPVYPAAALGRERGPTLVGVRITVDENGAVSNVRSSLLAFSTPGPFAADFLAAVEEALAQWRFRPAELRHLRPIEAASGPGGWALIRREKTDCVFDLSFTFSAAGDVLSGVPR